MRLETADRLYREAWRKRNECAARPNTEYNVRVLMLAERHLAWITEERRIARSRAIRTTLGILKT